MKNGTVFKYISINIFSAWLIVFALLPFLLVILCSFLTKSNTQLWQWTLTLQSYTTLFHAIYLQVFLRSFYLAALTTLFCLIIGYPCAYIMARQSDRIKSILMLLLIIPFWTSSLIRIYSMMIILRAQGQLSHFLAWLHVIHGPLDLLYTQTAVLIGMVYSLLPFMIFPLYALLEKFDWTLGEAARDLGASRWRYFKEIVIPLSVPGIISGIMLVFLPALTLFYIPDLLGGAKSLLLGNVIKNAFLESRNWPLGSAVSVILTAVMGLMLLMYARKTKPQKREV